VLAREVAELHREKMELLEENASLEERSRVSAWPVLFAWELYRSCPFSCQRDEQ
jgi:hypothetical protein